MVLAQGITLLGVSCCCGDSVFPVISNPMETMCGCMTGSQTDESEQAGCIDMEDNCGCNITIIGANPIPVLPPVTVRIVNENTGVQVALTTPILIEENIPEIPVSSDKDSPLKILHQTQSQSYLGVYLC